MFVIEYHVHIKQVLPQLSCGAVTPVKYDCDSKNVNRYFWEMEKFAYWEIDERSFSNPHPSTSACLGDIPMPI